MAREDWQENLGQHFIRQAMHKARIVAPIHVACTPISRLGQQYERALGDGRALSHDVQSFVLKVRHDLNTCVRARRGQGQGLNPTDDASSTNTYSRARSSNLGSESQA